jgi:hypothetical protein
MTTDPDALEDEEKSPRSTAANAVIASADSARASRAGKAGGMPPVQEPPDALVQRFVKRGQDFLFPDGALAFTDQGERLTTPSENSEVVRTLIAIAQDRGWQEIAVSGTERFRTEASSQAVMQGIAVRGYEPDEKFRERIARSDRSERETEEEAVIAGAEPDASRRPDRRPIRGTLREHGRAPYQHEPGKPMSYYATIETPRGTQEVWGVDLERALRESVSQPQVGDEVVLRTAQQVPVTVRTVETNESGESVEAPKVVNRNRWSVEKASFVEERQRAAQAMRDPTSDPREVLKTQPELVGAYVALRAAEEIAKKRISNPEDQQRFVTLVRAEVNERISLGERAPELRTRVREPKRTRERDSKDRGIGD